MLCLLTLKISHYSGHVTIKDNISQEIFIHTLFINSDQSRIFTISKTISYFGVILFNLKFFREKITPNEVKHKPALKLDWAIPL